MIPLRDWLAPGVRSRDKALLTLPILVAPAVRRTEEFSQNFIRRDTRRADWIQASPAAGQSVVHARSARLLVLG
jgi:hypothetical protein